MTDEKPSIGSADATKLRALLASADPAASLTPLRGDDLHRLKEHTMTNNSARPTGTTPDSAGASSSAAPSIGGGANRRRWIATGVAGLGVAAAAAVVIPNLTDTDNPGGPDSPGEAPVAATSELTQPASAGAGAPGAMCAEVTPEVLAGYDTAFRADVTSIEGDEVTLAVTDRFAGDIEDTVVTTQGDGSGVDGAALVFDEGTTYLISTQDDQIITCGVSAEDDPALDDLYRTAFAQ